MRSWIALVAVAGCGRYEFADRADARSVDAPDAALPWSAPSVVAGVSIAGMRDEDCTMTGDRLELYFASDRAGKIHTFRATRPDPSSPWTTPAQIPTLQSTFFDSTPEVTASGLFMMFTSDRQSGATDFFSSTRPTRADEWGPPTYEGVLSTDANAEYGAAPTDDGLTVVFSSTRSGNHDLFIATRSATTAPWNAPVPIAELNTPGTESDPFLRADGLALYFTSDATGNEEIVVSTRETSADPFGPPSVVPELSSPASEQDIWISPDLRHALFASDRNGDFDVYEVDR